MNPRWPIALLFFSVSSAVLAATPTCQFAKRPVGEQKLGQWIDKGNWLAIENQRLTLQSAPIFMPAWHLPPPTERPLAVVPEHSLDDLPAVDPLDSKPRNLGFLLDSRLAVDGLVVLRNGQFIAERYRNGLVPDRPRLLLEATRPLLNLLGAISVSQGKLAADRSVTRYLPGLATSGSLRKMSIQRLLDGEEHYAWTPAEITSWRKSAGWEDGVAGNSIRGWLAQIDHWDKSLIERRHALGASLPEDDLLAWVLAEGNGQPLSHLFCEQLLLRTRPEHEVLWLSDMQGVELADGLALSLRDFARIGQLIVEARSSRSRTKIPGWFIETLVASTGMRAAEITGLTRGSEMRYGFIHLGGAPNRVALIGTHGTSLYLDFDKRLVVAIFATYPPPYTPAMLALLEQTWRAIGHGVVPPKKRQ
jgi:CubicO group peptidase (beta-lactamase class C family)